eukprot:g2647.t1
MYVKLYFDCISPFSYFAFTVLKRYKQRWGMKLELAPFLLGGVMKATNNIPPMARPWAAAASTFASQDMKRAKDFYNISFLGPPGNFFGPDGPADKLGIARDMRYQRLLTAICLKYDTQPDTPDGDQRNNGNVIITEAKLLSICRQAGFSLAEADSLVSSINDADVKNALKLKVEEAVQEGAFGAPTMIVTKDGSSDKMIFFGSDRLEHLAFACNRKWEGPDPDRKLSSKL